MSCLPWPCYFGAVLFIFLEPVVYLGVVHLLGMVSTGLMKGSIRDVVFSQMVLDDYECMRGRFQKRKAISWHTDLLH